MKEYKQIRLVVFPSGETKKDCSVIFQFGTIEPHKELGFLVAVPNEHLYSRIYSFLIGHHVISIDRFNTIYPKGDFRVNIPLYLNPITDTIKGIIDEIKSLVLEIETNDSKNVHFEYTIAFKDEFAELDKRFTENNFNQ